MLGGSAVHFALAASFFTEVRVVGPVGDDFGEEELAVLEGRGVVTDDIEHVAGGKTFFWRATTSTTSTSPTPTTPSSTCSATSSRSSRRRRARRTCSSWATSSPSCSAGAGESAAQFAALDSMNLWIETERRLARRRDRRDRLRASQRRRDPDADRRAQPGAARAVMEMGPRWSSRSGASTARRCSPRRRLLRDPGLPARGRPRPDRRRRQLRRRLPRLPRRRRARVCRDRSRRAAPLDGLRLGARLVQRRGLRYRAVASLSIDEVGSASRSWADHPFRARIGAALSR